MKLTFHRLQWLGVLGLLIPYFFAFSRTPHDSIPLFVLYCVLAFGASFFSVAALSSVMGKDKTPFALTLVPDVLLCVSDLVFGFGVALPFAALGYGLVALECLLRAAERTDAKAPEPRTVLFAGGLGFVLYVILTLSFAIFA